MPVVEGADDEPGPVGIVRFGVEGEVLRDDEFRSWKREKVLVNLNGSCDSWRERRHEQTKGSEDHDERRRRREEEAEDGSRKEEGRHSGVERSISDRRFLCDLGVAISVVIQ